MIDTSLPQFVLIEPDLVSVFICPFFTPNSECCPRIVNWSVRSDAMLCSSNSELAYRYGMIGIRQQNCENYCCHTHTLHPDIEQWWSSICFSSMFLPPPFLLHGSITLFSSIFFHHCSWQPFLSVKTWWLVLLLWLLSSYIVHSSLLLTQSPSPTFHHLMLQHVAKISWDQRSHYLQLLSLLQLLTVYLTASSTAFSELGEGDMFSIW